MSDQPKDVKDLHGAELVQWFLSRPPLFTDSVEFEGMSLCFTDPDLDQEEVPAQNPSRTIENDRASA